MATLMRRQSLAINAFLDRVWYGASRWYRALLPFSWLYGTVASLRRYLFRRGLLRAFQVPVPVIVVGNITVGGTGKTPVTLWLAGCLKDRGMRPGIASRGYGAAVGSRPAHVLDDSNPRQVGDEPLLMARRTICPVVVHPDRVAAAQMLIDMGCNVIVADDGLQHYRLKRQFEIIVVDGARGFGNRRLLPAGPLREPVQRLAHADQVMLQGKTSDLNEHLGAGVAPTLFELSVTSVRNLQGHANSTLDAFQGRTVHGIAAIGHPQRFFRLLESHDINVIAHAFPDHAGLTAQDLHFDDGLDVLMTEKDAVKFSGATATNWWYVTVDLTLPEGTEPDWLDGMVAQLKMKSLQ